MEAQKYTHQNPLEWPQSERHLKGQCDANSTVFVWILNSPHLHAPSSLWASSSFVLHVQQRFLLFWMGRSTGRSRLSTAVVSVLPFSAFSPSVFSSAPFSFDVSPVDAVGLGNADELELLLVSPAREALLSSSFSFWRNSVKEKVFYTKFASAKELR